MNGEATSLPANASEHSMLPQVENAAKYFQLRRQSPILEGRPVEDWSPIGKDLIAELVYLISLGHPGAEEARSVAEQELVDIKWMKKQIKSFLNSAALAERSTPFIGKASTMGGGSYVLADQELPVHLFLVKPLEEEKYIQLKQKSDILSRKKKYPHVPSLKNPHSWHATLKPLGPQDSSLEITLPVEERVHAVFGPVRAKVLKLFTRKPLGRKEDHGLVVLIPADPDGQ